MLLFTVVISLATGVLFGLGPLFGTRHVKAAESLKQNTRTVSGLQSRLRSGLAVAQIAIAIVLLIGAGLMAKSFWALLRVAPGFRSESILTARLSLPRSRYPDNSKIAAFERELSERLLARPGIQSAGFASYLPLSGTDNGWAFFIEGRPPLPDRGLEHGEIPAGQSRLFRDDRDADAARTVVHHGGHGWSRRGSW